MAVLGALFVASAMACKSERSAPVSGGSAAPRTIARIPRPSASASTSASAFSLAKPPAPNAPPELATELERWNAATNAADRQGLEAVYATSLTLYGRVVTRAVAIRRKLEYVAKHPKFSQTLATVSWSEWDGQRVARFRKTSRSEGAAESSVDAFLVFKELEGAWRIVDEGDVQSARKQSVDLDTLRKNWKPFSWPCPKCSDPELGDDPPVAGPPLGPDRVEAKKPLPPGAPAFVEYGRADFPRFASAVDVPLFLTATPQSTNGDGRWFYYDAPSAPSAPSSEPKHLLECAIGGHFWPEALPAGAKPDPGHVGDPKVSYTTLFEKRDGALYYERMIYAADGVYNYVTCSFDPAYEAFFHPIVERMGRSIRALGGGQPDRVDRVSQPYTAE